MEHQDHRPGHRVFHYPSAFRWLLPSRRGRETIEVDEDGIAAVDGGWELTRLRWEDVKHIKERRLLQRIEIHGGPGNVIHVRYRLKGFEELLQILLFRVNVERMPPGSDGEKFHPDFMSSLFILLPLVTFLGTGAFVAFWKFPLPGIGAAIWASTVLFLIALVFLSLKSGVLLDGGWVRVRGFYAGKVLLSDVASVSIHMWNQRGTQVILLLKSSKKRFLPPVREGSFALYRTLHARLESLRRNGAADGARR